MLYPCCDRWCVLLYKIVKQTGSPTLPVRSASSRYMIAGVPGVPVFPFPGLVEVGGKAGVPGVFWLIQVYDHRRSWCSLANPGVWSPVFLVSQSFPFQDWLRSVAKLVFLVCSASSRCMITGVPGVPVFPFPWSVEAVGHCKAGVPGAFHFL